MGVLALQGAFARHRDVFESLGARVVEVRQPEHLEGIDALVLPGGESTTMFKLAASSGLWQPMKELVDGGLAVLGTCAGAILLAVRVLDGRPDQEGLGGLDAVVRRNGYGRQIDSFEADVAIEGLDEAFHAVFIRAPRFEELGQDVDVLARWNDDAVVARQDRVMAATFHPELTADQRIHQLFLDLL